MKKVNMISQIVRLKQAVSRWKSKSLSRNRRAPAGSVAVYVGMERRRFVVPTRFLNLPVFVALLNQAEEEFGYQASGALVLPCEAGFFGCVVRLLEKEEEEFQGLGLHEFVQLISEARLMQQYDWASCMESCSSPAACPRTPLLQKTRV